MLGRNMTPNIRVSLILPVAIVLMCGLVGNAHAHKPTNSAALELSTQEKLEAEQRLWDLGYWAGPVDSNPKRNAVIRAIRMAQLLT